MLVPGICNWLLPLQFFVANQILYSLTVPLVVFQDRGQYVASADVDAADGIYPKWAVIWDFVLTAANLVLLGRCLATLSPSYSTEMSNWQATPYSVTFAASGSFSESM